MVRLLLLWSISVGVPMLVALPRFSFNYHTHNDMSVILQQIATDYSNLTHLYSIGTSTEHRELWVIAIGKEPKSAILLRPNVKLVGSVHGNEATPKEILLQFIEYLLTNYGKNDEVTRLLDTTLVHIMPLLNPDGAARALNGTCEGPGRENAYNLDLNRNFPDAFHPTYKPKRQRETAAVMEWLRNRTFVLSASLHNGALLVSIPYDNYEKSWEDFSMLSPTPDDDVFRNLAEAYSFSHPNISSQTTFCGHDFHDGSLVNGTINGADWYASNGTMQDYNYIYASCMELTVEIGCCKFPRATNLPQLWRDNKDALLNFVRKVHMGVRGLITDETGATLKDVSVAVGQRMPVQVTSDGEFWKLLLPGNDYQLQVVRNNLVVSEQRFSVTAGKVTFLNVTIKSNFPVRQFNTSNLPGFGRILSSASSCSTILAWNSQLLSVLNVFVLILLSSTK